MKKSVFYFVLFLSVIMVNPPVVYWVNDYCIAHPLTFGWPTMFWWLEFWYVVMIADFGIAALTMKSWDCHQDSRPIEPVRRGD